MKHPTSTIGMPACGPLRTFRLTARRCVGAGPRAVSRRGLAVAALAFSEGALRCSLREGDCDAAVGAAERGAHLTASRRPGGYAGLPLAALRCSPAPMRPDGIPPSGLEPTLPRASLECGTRVPARLGA